MHAEHFAFPDAQFPTCARSAVSGKRKALPVRENLYTIYIDVRPGILFLEVIMPARTAGNFTTTSLQEKITTFALETSELL